MTQVFTIQRPSRSPTDSEIREAVYIQQQGEIAFSLGEIARAQLLMVRKILQSKENKA